MIEITVTKDILKSARKREKEYHKKYGNRGTHRVDKKNHKITGFLGEEAVKEAVSFLEFSKTDDVDFVHNNITFDVKSQGCNTKPRLNYVGTLYKEQEDRIVDFYIFTRVKNDLSKVWIMGFMSKEEFLSKAKLIDAGVKNNNFTYDQARYEIEYNELSNMSEL